MYFSYDTPHRTYWATPGTYKAPETMCIMFLQYMGDMRRTVFWENYKLKLPDLGLSAVEAKYMMEMCGKDIVTLAQSRVARHADAMSSRTHFMIETLNNLKNNKIKKTAATQHQGGDAVEWMKKFLSSLGKKKHDSPIYCYGTLSSLRFSPSMSLESKDPIGLWIGHLPWDSIFSVILAIIIIIIFAITMNQFNGLGFFWVILVLYGIVAVAGYQIVMDISSTIITIISIEPTPRSWPEQNLSEVLLVWSLKNVSWSIVAVETYTLWYFKHMARGITKKIAAAVNKPGRKATTTLASALQEQHEEAQQTLLKAKGTQSHHAFNIIPNKNSASVLELFLVQKGLTEGWSLSTTWGIFSGFKDMWKNACILSMSGCAFEALGLNIIMCYSKGETYCGPYHCDKGTGVVAGNPALSAAAQDMMEVLKNNEGAEGGSRNHASAMTIKDMRKLMAWSYSQYPDEVVSHICQSVEGRSTLDVADMILAQQHLMVRAFSTIGIMIWTRNFELTKIKRKDIIWNCQGRPPYGIPFDLWKGEIDGALEGHEYEVYAQLKTPEICMFMHLRAWMSFLEEVLLQWPLQPEEYVFPRIGTNGVVYPSDELSYDAVMKTLTWICTEAGLTARYTSHCFRRGGVRYWFMFAPLGECWLLAMIHWWGAWAEGESLTQYEKNHWDALCPIPREGDKSFNGDHILTAPITAAETRELKMSFDRELNHLSGKVEEVLDKLTLAPASSPYSSPLTAPSQLLILVSSTQSLQPTPCHQAIHSPSPQSTTAPSMIPVPVPMDSTSSPSPPVIPTTQALPSNSRQHGTTTKKVAPIPSVGIPDLPREPEAWRTAVKQWEDPAASIGGKALKDWPEEWYTRPMCTITGVKWNIWKVIAMEFYWLQQDEATFVEAYPEATCGVKPLFDAIQRQREGQGEITGRASKNSRPEVQVSSH
ncbi:uncharacterized protein EDB91DRAFT_1077109 [Suillus paluster]|uniref:uncharacterized protein n=1 Tax=Suillus paluster TaxID=48578 RepID=UPI001B86A5D4|nr:uncharacterized protein EDB91DRAFT_1077109 [Suillus paluster]KAG1755099.1 hypothetical protein EDB91DRAFT_1077109 [Suillus paluster]